MGMGSFDLQVVPGEFYTARLMLPGGVLKSYPLPAVENTGTVLLVNNLFESDSLEVTLAAGAETARQGKNYYLSGVARGIVCYAAIVNFNLAGVIKRKIAKELFPSEITRFTLSATDGQPFERTYHLY